MYVCIYVYMYVYTHICIYPHISTRVTHTIIKHQIKYIKQCNNNEPTEIIKHESEEDAAEEVGDVGLAPAPEAADQKSEETLRILSLSLYLSIYIYIYTYVCIYIYIHIIPCYIISHYVILCHTILCHNIVFLFILLI